MKLRGERVEQLAAARGITPEQLAAAVERPSLKGDRALSAVQNWMRNNDHPRCKAEDCRKIAAALGATLPEVVKFTSAVFNSRGSARKAKLVVDMIRGKQVDAAMNMLTFTTKKAAVNVKKCLAAALADAESFEADVSKLYVLESTCDDGMQIKRFQPKDRGRAHPIIKRSSNIVVSVGTKGPKKAK